MTGLITAAVLAVMLPSFFNGRYFVGGGDVKTQWFPFYILNRRETVTALKKLSLPFYSFVLFLGNNIWASKSSYGLFDIYNVISYVLDSDYFAIYNIQVFVKLIVSGISFYLLTDYIYKDRKTASAAGLCYALGSYGIYFSSQPGFLSFFSLAPLYFLGMERYLREKKKYLFIITVFLLLITNYYFFYACSLFSPLYFIYRYWNIHGELKGFFKEALLLVGYYLIGVLLSGVIILPAFLYVIQNERVGSFGSGFSYKDLSVYYHLLIAPFVPSHTYIYGNSIFEMPDHNLKEICLYSGSLISVLIPQFLSDRDKIFRKSTVILYALLAVFTFTPFISSLFNGFSEPCFRWFYLFVIMDILTASRYLKDPELINRKNLLYTVMAETVLIVLVFLLCLSYRSLVLADYLKQILILGVTVLFIIMAGLLVTGNRKAVTVLCFVELLLFGTVYGIRSIPNGLSKYDYEHVTGVLADSGDPNYLNTYLDSLSEGNDREFFRIYVPYNSLYWSFSHDLSAVYNVKGLMTYDSTYAQSFNRMRDIAYDGVVDVIDWEFRIEDRNIMNFLSTRYAITVSEDEIPFADYEIVDDSYRGTLLVSQNNDCRPFGTTYTKNMTYEEFASVYKNDTGLLNEYVITDADIKEYPDTQTSTAYDVFYEGNHLSMRIDCEDDSFLVLSLPYDEGWKVMINGEKSEYFECNGGMTGMTVNAGHNEIEMYFVPKGFKAGAVLTAVGALTLFTLIIIDARKRRKV